MRKVIPTLLAVMATAAFLAFGAFAKDCSEVNVNDFLDETQLSSDDSDKMVLLWWIPVEYWCISTAGDASVTEEDLEQFNDILKDYTIIAVVDGNMSEFGAVRFKSEGDVKEHIVLKNTSGKEFLPLKDEAVNPDTRSFLSILKPILANMMGEMGENMHFIVFPGTDPDGNRLGDPATAGSLTAVYNGEDFSWRLPLGSMMDDKSCPKCGEKCSGAWSYCPYDGTEL